MIVYKSLRFQTHRMHAYQLMANELKIGHVKVASLHESYLATLAYLYDIRNGNRSYKLRLQRNLIMTPRNIELVYSVKPMFEAEFRAWKSGPVILEIHERKISYLMSFRYYGALS